MQRVLSTAFAWVAMCLPALAQLNVLDEYGQYEPVEITSTYGPQTKALWDLLPLDGQTQFTVRDYVSKDGQDVTLVFAQPGRYSIEGTAVTIDWELQSFDIERIRHTFSISGTVPPSPTPPEPPVPPGPGPTPPEPAPSLPADFDGLAGNVATQAIADNLQVDKRMAVAEVYRGVSKKMTSNPPEILRSSDAVALLKSGVAQLGLGQEWNATFSVIREDAARRGSLDWATLARWYDIVGIGLGGQE